MSLASKKVNVGKLQFRWDYVLLYVSLRFLQGGGIGESGVELFGLDGGTMFFF